MANNNSYAENLSKLIKKSNDAISVLSGVHESIISDKDSVNINVGDTSITIPSYNNVLNKIKNVENTVSTFTSGAGTVRLSDGTHRSVEVTNLPSVPQKITNLNSIDTFNVSSNWFFENLMFPKIVVNIDLKDKIDDYSDRVVVKRVIIDRNVDDKENVDAIYNNQIKDKKLVYPELISLLNNNNIKYYEDDEILDFPLLETKYYGDFTILDSVIENGVLYYILDDVYYGVNTIDDIIAPKNIKLIEGDTLKYRETIYTIDKINNDKVSLTRTIGFDNIGVGVILTKYNEPFKDKNIDIPIGYNEINCLYLKGVNEKYNIVSNEWSDLVSFNSNTLKYYADNSINLDVYYNTYVSDFGAEWLAQAKERTISAYNGIKPDAPSLIADNFKVVQINKQINASLDENEVKQIQSSILSLKNSAATIRKTIARQKTDLISIEDVDARIEQEKLIKLNTDELNNITSEYESNVDYLSSYLNEKKASTNNPKYRVRGFFSVPEPKYSYNLQNEKLGKQEIIGFEIRYRYLKLDNMGVPLTTFNFLDTSNNTFTGVFSDWIMYTSSIKERTYNKELDIFEWKNENAADGNEININQIDIPITSGEKVEFCVRSISEAGYPLNPLKSDWSKSIIIEFPENLSASNQLSNILNDVKSEQNNIALNNVLKSAGYYSHISDETPANDNDSTQYHHKSSNILFEMKDSSTGEVINQSVESLLKTLLSEVNDIKSQLLNLSEQNDLVVRYVDASNNGSGETDNDIDTSLTLRENINRYRYDIRLFNNRLNELEKSINKKDVTIFKK